MYEEGHNPLPNNFEEMHLFLNSNQWDYKPLAGDKEKERVIM